MSVFPTFPLRKDDISLDPRRSLPRDAPPPPPESVRTAFVRSYADVITKFSRLDGFTNFSYQWCFA